MIAILMIVVGAMCALLPQPVMNIVMEYYWEHDGRVIQSAIQGDLEEFKKFCFEYPVKAFTLSMITGNEEGLLIVLKRLSFETEYRNIVRSNQFKENIKIIFKETTENGFYRQTKRILMNFGAARDAHGAKSHILLPIYLMIMENESADE